MRKIVVLITGLVGRVLWTEKEVRGEWKVRSSRLAWNMEELCVGC